MSNNRTVVLNGKKVNLTDADYIAQGGQGVVYMKNGVVFKVYHDVNQLIPEDKIDELQVLSGIKNVIIPSKSIYDPKTKKRIGFVMRYVADTEFLCKLFVGNFKKQNNISPKMIVEMVNSMQTTLNDIHKAGVIVGDYNEMNFLTDKKFSIPYFIDTDSYQTPSYKCNAIMDSVRDRTLAMGEFNEHSDWFSWAIVSFQLYTGIHPYKGKHPKFKMNDFDGRMTNNISVFHKDVTVPKFVNMTGIPKAHMDWFKQVFVNGERSIPPFSDGSINYAVIQNVFTDPNASVVATLLYAVGETILDIYWSSGKHFILTVNGFYEGDEKQSDFTMDIDRGKLICTDTGEFVFIIEFDKVLYAFDSEKNLIKKFEDVDYQSYMVVNNCLYVKQESGLVQYSFEVIGRLKMIASPIATLNHNSSKMFDGVVLQELYGKLKAIIPYEYNKASMVDLTELKTNHIHDAKVVGDWLFVLADDNGKINLHKFMFNKTFTTYEYKVAPDVNMRNINAIVMPNGMIVMNTEDETIELFFDYKRGTKVIDESPLQNNLNLVNGKTACFVDDNKVYSVRMK